MTPTELILFDLDGTLVDTAPDMVRALNELLVDEGRAPLAYAEARYHVSHGAAGLLHLAYGPDVAADDTTRRHREFLERYGADPARDSQLFPGIQALLDEIEASGRRWGVVTNKPDWLTRPVLDALELAPRAACVVAGDTLAVRKPDPRPITHACRLAGTTPQHAVYIGDAERDIVAGRSAGSRSYVALFGYIAPSDDPQSWGADALLTRPGDLWQHIERGRREAAHP